MITQGVIVSLDFGNFLVFVDGKTYRATMPKTDKIKLTPVVGDAVIIDIDQQHIIELLPRTSFIKRPRLANLSDLLIVTSMVEPAFSFSLLALFITFARYYNLHVKILVTKTDRMPATTYQEAWDYLKDAGFQVDFFSSESPNQAHLASMIREGKTIAFAGQTGVGKSTLMNLLNPDYARTIGSYSEALGRGKHQTKEVILFPYRNSFIADTPGFSSLVLPMVKHEAAKVFPGFETAFVHCKFFNCTHQGEPGCHIQTLVKRGKIPLTFYQDYLKLIAKLPERKAFE